MEWYQRKSKLAINHHQHHKAKACIYVSWPDNPRYAARNMAQDLVIEKSRNKDQQWEVIHSRRRLRKRKSMIYFVISTAGALVIITAYVAKSIVEWWQFFDSAQLYGNYRVIIEEAFDMSDCWVVKALVSCPWGRGFESRNFRCEKRKAYIGSWIHSEYSSTIGKSRSFGRENIFSPKNT